MTTTSTTAVLCPECEGEVAIADSVRVSEIVECGECRSELEVVAVGPAVLARAPEVEEDWGE
jgi:alpha-aminoadipate/glutamate carrier protein LysW